jgi:hypothetical protein
MIDYTAPESVLPMLAESAEALYDALRMGTSFADGLQPDKDHLDLHFWSHSARFQARNYLAQGGGLSWTLVSRVPNSGIRMLIDGIHSLRVVKSLDGEIPPPGANKARNDAWVGVGVRNQLALPLGRPGQDLTQQPLSLIADWFLDEQREPIVHVSLPKRPWPFGCDPQCFWRVLLSPGNSLALEDLPGFSGEEGGDPTITIKVDPLEWENDGES